MHYNLFSKQFCTELLINFSMAKGLLKFIWFKIEGSFGSTGEGPNDVITNKLLVWQKKISYKRFGGYILKV